MQTFVPYPNHYITADVLDNQRLFKQLVEGKQILKALSDPEYGWQHHPAVEMWRGHEQALIFYILVLADNWTVRGLLRGTNTPYNETITSWIYENYDVVGGSLPPWWGGPIHLSHQRKLVWKDPEWYCPRLQLPPIHDEPEYYWPSKEPHGRAIRTSRESRTPTQKRSRSLWRRRNR